MENESQIKGYHNRLLLLDWNNGIIRYAYKRIPGTFEGKIEGVVIAWVESM